MKTKDRPVIKQIKEKLEPAAKSNARRTGQTAVELIDYIRSSGRPRRSKFSAITAWAKRYAPIVGVIATGWALLGRKRHNDE